MPEVVYFPYMRFPKSAPNLGALLLWDRIYVIRPREVRGRPLTIFDEALLREGIVEHCHVEDDKKLLHQVLGNFCVAVRQPEVQEFVRRTPASPSEHIEFYGVHKDKMALSAIREIKASIPELVVGQDHDFFTFPTGLASLYMSLLAEAVAYRKAAGLLSDVHDSLRLHDRFFLRDDNPGARNMANRRLDAVVTATAQWFALRGDTSVKKLLAFRSRYRKDLHEVHSVMEKLASRIRDTEDYQEAVQQSAYALDEKIREIRSRLTEASFVIRNVPWLTVAGAALGLITGTAIGVEPVATKFLLTMAGVGIDVAIRRVRRKDPDVEFVNGYRYILRARERFGRTHEPPTRTEPHF
jgi:ElaB/YqjD/DUF883 family membrane-anchored ribosome-binding protein